MGRPLRSQCLRFHQAKLQRWTELDLGLVLQLGRTLFDVQQRGLIAERPLHSLLLLLRLLLLLEDFLPLRLEPIQLKLRVLRTRHPICFQYLLLITQWPLRIHGSLPDLVGVLREIEPVLPHLVIVIVVGHRAVLLFAVGVYHLLLVAHGGSRRVVLCVQLLPGLVHVK